MGANKRKQARRNAAPARWAAAVLFALAVVAGGVFALGGSGGDGAAGEAAAERNAALAAAEYVPASVNTVPMPVPVVAAIGAGSRRYDVTAYGAKANDKRDDTAAIQKAIDKAGAAGGGVVYVPKGTYLVSDTLVLGRDDVVLKGAGWDSVLRMTVHPKRVVEIRGSERNAVRDIQLALGVRDGVRDDRDEGVYVSEGASDFIIENVFGNGKGIMLRGGVSNGIVRNNSIRDTLADGIHVTGGSTDILVEGNSLNETGDDAIAVVSYKSQGALSQRISIRGNVVRDSATRGIAFVGGERVDILDNDVARTGSSGILVVRDTNYDTYGSAKALVRGNAVADAGLARGAKGNTFGIEIAAGAAEATLLGNTVTDSVGRGISVSAAGTVVHDNTVARSGGSGLDLQADDCSVTDNRLSDNGEYGIVATGSDRMVIWGNSLLNNNASGRAGVDNFLLKDCDDATVSHNESAETRRTMRVERAYEATGTCANLVFEHNESSGTRLGTLIACRK